MTQKLSCPVKESSTYGFRAVTKKDLIEKLEPFDDDVIVILVDDTASSERKFCVEKVGSAIGIFFDGKFQDKNIRGEYY